MRGVLLGLVVGAIGVAAGCASPPERRGGLADRPVVERGVAGTSVEGRPIEYLAVGPGPEVVLVVATIHGDEPAGTPLLARLETEYTLDPDLLRGVRLVLVPLANPDGYAAGTRTNVRGVDLNRNFPSKNFTGTASRGTAPLSEPESLALFDLVERFEPDRIASFHQPLACIDWDGPAEDWARALATTCDLPVKKLGGRPGSFGSWTGIDLGIPIVTIELPASSHRRSPESLWADYGELVIAIVRGEAPAHASSR
ncbi:MAG: M14 family zinc carboxypeptidase [Planctomycetota bacterium]